MAQTISGIASSIRAEIDTAFGNDPEQDFEVLAASLISNALPDSGDISNVLNLAGLDPSNSFSNPEASRDDAYSTMEAYLQAAIDDELAMLRNP